MAKIAKDPNENYKEIINNFDKLEDSGALGSNEKTGSMEESSMEKFIRDPNNWDFLSEADKKKVLESKKIEAKTIKKDVIKEEQLIVDWDLVERLYHLGRKKGFID